MTIHTAADTLITDAGLETWLIFHRGVDLPAFAAYPLASTASGRALLSEYFDQFIAIADSAGAGVQLDAPTWRANPEWARHLGHDLDQLAGFIDDAIGVVTDARRMWTRREPFLVGGAVGPRGDGYRVNTAMSPEQAAEYHDFQVRRMAAAGTDVVTALTMGYVGEAAGIAIAARRAGLPTVVSFTVETDGRLPSGNTLAEAIDATDEITSGYPSYYMVNCAHPVHVAAALEPGEAWMSRIGGLRANASTRSHAELDEMTELDEGDPDDLARRYVGLRHQLPNLRLIGGCCGTDHRHVAAIAREWRADGRGVRGASGVNASR